MVSLYAASQYGGVSGLARALGESVALQFAYILIVEIIAVGAILLFLKRYKTSVRAIGLRWPRASDISWALLALPVYYLLFFATVLVAKAIFPGLDTQQEQAVGFDGAQGLVPLILVYISLAVLPPVAEEIMVRGFLYTSLRKHLSVVVAGIISSIVFAAAHLSGAASGGLLWIAAIDTFVLALVLVYLREKTAGLWACIFLHAAKNSVAYYILFL